MELAYFNGWVGSLEEARVSVNDRGYNFGDGVYEVVRAYNGVMFALEEHLARLALSAAAVEIDLPWAPARLKNIIVETLGESGIKDALIYIQVTRGTAPRGHVPEEEMRPNLLVTVRNMPDIPPSLYSEGVKAITMPEFRWQMCSVKSISLQASVLAKRRAERAGAAEAFFVLPDGTVTEGASSNIFIVGDGALITHPADNRVLAGVIRHFVLKVAGTLGVKAMEEPFNISDLMKAEEVFITGTVAEIVPVVNVDGKIIGGGRPGPLTARIHKGFASLHK
ncbi:aminotransferase class IV [Pelotomaculum propionicicum]|uniref:aminotransferase class IV n=1 Tax=Pelotomaculum propionicicum TaxID=258475 RepID=UPI003B7EF631